eukprot:CAMPEP_0113570916 /NCGR_PEP_ID=MMETSP0015_2-20120614/25261_1 /TAXON_ID=2838 /ORGANISM="Odontella" /LENGTH=228 /DNA_ID=CAMNT_0000473803 /DNA_START=56 /DNA_END=743 /DNA_ORIENTATION=- /assembly_acc=CAM_ASM_000160
MNIAAVLLALAGTSSAFVAPNSAFRTTGDVSLSATAAGGDRRAFLGSAAAAFATAAFAVRRTELRLQTTGDVSLSATAAGGDRRAFLGSAAAAFATAAFAGISPASAAYEQTWLTEPTEEFKENEARAAEFKKKEIMAKKEFNAAIDNIVNVAQTEEELVKGIDELTRLVAQFGGLPTGLSKEDMYKKIRSKKAKGFWPTAVEYSYQELKLEVIFQQSPNQDKELGRP